MITPICGSISNNSNGHIELVIKDNTITLQFVDCYLNTTFHKVYGFIEACIRSYRKKIPEYLKGAMTGRVLQMLSEAHIKSGNDMLNLTITGRIYREDNTIFYRVSIPNSEIMIFQYYKI